MGSSYNPKIVTDSLVLCLDAANPKSYPGSGTTWYDLSGNGNNGTLTNGPTYDTGNNGSIVFDGVNDYVAGNVGSLTAPFTFEVFGKFTNVTQTNYEYFGALGTASSGMTMFNIAKIGTQYANSSYHGFLYISNNTTLYKTNIDLKSTSYQHITIVAISTAPYIRLYKNGVEGAMVDALPTSFSIDGNYKLGTWSGGTWWLNGRIGATKVYNRALSASEIQQNFQATRGRYGL